MFEIFMMIGWAAVFIVLLYLWADVREVAAALKANKREFLRNNFGGRTSADYPGFREDEYWKTEGKAAVPEEGRAADKQKPLNESEEQVLREVLTEFLG